MYVRQRDMVWERRIQKNCVVCGHQEECQGRWWCTPLIPALRRQRQVDLCEFKANLVYKLSIINISEPTRQA